jgi:4-diphosphocytidyl-2-C-methyl-D-erythritol kinase
MLGVQALYNLPAPGKLNLHLHVTGRRKDGYHLLETVFQRIDWCDWLDVERRDDGQISLEMHQSKQARGVASLAQLTSADNLCTRAALMLRAHLGQPQLGAHISLKKNLPSGAGLGGGSSDAATTLLALNRLWNANLSAATLRRLALPLGADVPFFLFGSSAYATGIGEKLQKLALPALHFVVVHPGISVPTPQIFRDPKLTRNTKPAKIFGSLPRVTSSGDVELVGSNDLQEIAQRLYPKVHQARLLLEQAYVSASLSLRAKPNKLPIRMTGSGACVFAAFSQENQAQLVAREVVRLSNIEPNCHLVVQCCKALP